MDLDEWEFLSDDGFLDYHKDGGREIVSREHGSVKKSLLDMNYFICPPPASREIIGSPKNLGVPKQIVPVTIHLVPTIERAPDAELVKEITEVPVEISVTKVPVPIHLAPKAELAGTDQDTVSQVFFKKMKETEFVDMKMDSPRSGNRGIAPQIDAGAFQFEDKGEPFKGEEAQKQGLDSSDAKEEIEINWKENRGGLNVWKLGLTGVGAICSFGLAAATVCVLIFGSHQRNRQTQKSRFEIYTDDKRIKQAVHHASRLNEAISAVRGVPLGRGAHITFGGYYEGL